MKDTKDYQDTNSQRFLNAFNIIEKHMLRITRENIGVSFCSLVDMASKKYNSVQYFSVDLKEYTDLRNAIIHERTDGHAIAEPHHCTVEKIEAIANNLIAPPSLIPLFKQSVVKLRMDDSISSAVSCMLENSFSQIPIYEGSDFCALLNANTITRWLGACVETDIFSLKETPIQEVLRYSENQDNYCFLGKKDDLFSALKKFQYYEQKGKYLEAIMITQNGSKSELPIGIITIWDLPNIYDKLKI